MISKPSEHTLLLKKSKSGYFNRSFTTVIGFLIFPGLLILMLFSGRFIENPGYTFYLVAAGLSVAVAIVIATEVIEMSVNNRDFIFEKNNGSIIINSKTIITNQQIEFILIRGQKGNDGIGESFFVGLQADKFYPFVFYQTNEGAEHIASKLSEFFGVKVVRKSSKPFSFLKWH